MSKIIKTSELTGLSLDLAVAKCEERGAIAYLRDGKLYDPLCEEYLCYSTDWSLSGPIMETEKIEVSWRWDVTPGHTIGFWSADYWPNEWDNSRVWASGTGETILIATMRCYVASKLCDEIEVPEEWL